MKLIKFIEDKVYSERFHFVKGCVYELDENFALRWLKRGCLEITKEEMKEQKMKVSVDPRKVEDKKEEKKVSKPVSKPVESKDEKESGEVKEVKEVKDSKDSKDSNK